jgi:hypothetical protein
LGNVIQDFYSHDTNYQQELELSFLRTIEVNSDTSKFRLPIQILNPIIMNIHYSEQQTKAIKTLLYNQDLDNENIQLLKYSLRETDISDITLEDAQSIIAKMPQKDEAFVYDMLLGKVKPLIPKRYYMEQKAERLSKSTGFNILMGIFLIGVVAFGITLACIAFTGVWGFICGVFKFILPLI